ncbi:ribonuclease P protein component [Motilibacter rhizosphaerae]|uniref:Ribonuclease P protein component n=1 Tax=Motilibacter rhizosphaerae TaxID=598652 RepID=A0A4Q7NVL1_9ACTN|nr:ribonuclease P protein component [Motilibacter rhizosphaerae]RZS91227.1 ribonuclease P protein component [Motilibacter rhizosphaerae]
MLPPDARLRRPSDFSDVMRRGPGRGRGAAPALVVHARLLPAEPADAPSPLPPVRVGFAVPKAVGGAVVRNLVRRRLRELSRQRLPGWPPGASLVVRALPPAAGAGWDELGAQLDAAAGAALRRASVPRGAGVP